MSWNHTKREILTIVPEDALKVARFVPIPRMWHSQRHPAANAKSETSRIALNKGNYPGRVARLSEERPNIKCGVFFNVHNGNVILRLRIQ